MRKSMVISLTAALACLGPAASFASAAASASAPLPSNLTVHWDGEPAALGNNAFLVDNQLYAPYLPAASAMGAEAKWDADAKSLRLHKGNVTVELSAEPAESKEDAGQPAGAPLLVIGENAYVPVRFVYERFGYKVGYDPQKRAVAVTSGGTPAAEAHQAAIIADLDPEQAAGMRIEGVTGDKQGHLYTVDMDSKRLYRIVPETGKAEVLTILPRSATGMAFGPDGALYLASGGGQGVEGTVLRIPGEALHGGAFDASKVETFVSGTNGANGLVFGTGGRLYVSGGATGNVYIVTPDGKLTVWASGLAAEREEQKIVVNGLAFDAEGRLTIANTSSGEIWKAPVNAADGSIGTAERFAKSPLLYGADGIAFGPDGVLYVCANERNSIVKVTPQGEAAELAANGSDGPLEFPASVHIMGGALYISNFDQPRGANKPSEPGIGASIAKIGLQGSEQSGGSGTHH
ncbi:MULTISPECIES: SMP-30/gluconolactonase/LRE family protein [Paenibacillus]|uniref:SMP-30/gluconolactonase/LRE family protein n=1 Tax=Paenibacillus TaxID=44249 RepID=UPI0022B8BB32|nr:SMP-30/gluconolactonase/LRE family protein [Paenibacillus caseinilyticus]MCZ8521183.1 SMP-30/gluconolactonase/LRE family protein [Paenibacillus caseinilyticus]